MAVLALVVAALALDLRSHRTPATAGGASDRQATSPAATTTSPSPSPSPTTPPYRPPRIRPVVHPALRGEGVWRPAQRWAGRPAAALVAWYRPNPADPTARAYVAWFDASATRLALYAGYGNPAPSIAVPRGPTEVPPSARGRLLATFNGGFYLDGPPGFQPGLTIPGGFAVNGHLYTPMRRGLATVVGYTDGRIDVVDWRGGRRPGPDVVFARQNFPLLVAGGHPAPGVTVGPAWGETLHGAPAVWRTAIGVDAHGNLIYVAAADQTAPSLARLMVHVGAVRAMQLDINPEWPILAIFGRPGGGAPRLFAPNPNQIPNRFLMPSLKDFFAVYLRVGSGPYRREPF